MSGRVNIVNRIIMAIAVHVQAVDGFGVKVGGIVGADKSAPFGGVISGVAVIQAGVIIVVVATVADGVSIGNGGIGSLGRNRAVAPGIIQILGHHIAVGVAYILPNFPPVVKKKPPSSQVELGGLWRETSLLFLCFSILISSNTAEDKYNQTGYPQQHDSGFGANKK